MSRIPKALLRIHGRANPALWHYRIGEAATFELQKSVWWALAFVATLPVAFTTGWFFAASPDIAVAIGWWIAFLGCTGGTLWMMQLQFLRARNAAGRFVGLEPDQVRRLSIRTPETFDSSLEVLRSRHSEGETSLTPDPTPIVRAASGSVIGGWDSRLPALALLHRRRYLIFRTTAMASGVVFVAAAAILALTWSSFKWVPFFIGVVVYAGLWMLAIREFARARNLTGEGLGLPRDQTRRLDLRTVTRYDASLRSIRGDRP